MCLHHAIELQPQALVYVRFPCKAYDYIRRVEYVMFNKRYKHLASIVGHRAEVRPHPQRRHSVGAARFFLRRRRGCPCSQM